MSGHCDPSEDAAPKRRHRTRLVPPRIGQVPRHVQTDRKAERWAHGLRGHGRHRLLVIAGNVLLFGALVGLPLVRGHYRATATQTAYHAFIGCVYGVPSSGGLGELHGEPEYLAARLADSDRSWVPKCQHLLSVLAPDAALFLLPTVKEAEARVREAVRITRTELGALAAHQPGLRMPERSLRALTLLRSTVRVQLERASAEDLEAVLPVTLAEAPRLPAPSTLPVYAAADASLDVWGDDQTLRVVALDSTGLSFLELEWGKPFTRARLVRSSALRGFARFDASAWLAWATPPARCAKHSEGCFGKTTQVAAAPTPLLRLPESRTLATHLAGRVDRSIVPTAQGLLVAGVTSDRHKTLQEFAVPSSSERIPDLPTVTPARTWPTVLDEVLTLASAGESLVVGLKREGQQARLLRVTREGAETLSALGSGNATWLTGCKDGRHAVLAFGDGEHVRLGALERQASGWRAHFWPELSFLAQSVIDADLPHRDRVVALCSPNAALVVALDADERLSAMLCRRDEEPCKSLPLADGVTHFSALETPDGALVAYASETAPQIRIRSIDVDTPITGVDYVPAACWTNHGVCTRPRLARVGGRVLLLAPDKTDLLVLESGDQGRSFRPLPVL